MAAGHSAPFARIWWYAITSNTSTTSRSLMTSWPKTSSTALSKSPRKKGSVLIETCADIPDRFDRDAALPVAPLGAVTLSDLFCSSHGIVECYAGSGRGREGAKSRPRIAVSGHLGAAHVRKPCLPETW